MNDLISRQAAIDAIERNSCNTQRSIEAVNALPSVQPVDKDINVSCKDVISRQAAIRWVKTECNPYGKPTLEFESGKRVMEHLETMPSVQPERKKDTIQKFHDYQVEWLKSHYDIELEPQLEEMIIRFLHDTANRYMMEEGG